MTYEEQLQTPEWKVKREEILSRDSYMCQHCMSTRGLQVHHKKYIPGRLAWEYHTTWEMSYLVTLCRECHAKEHGIEYIDRGDYKISPNHPYQGGIDGRPVRRISEIMSDFLRKITNG